MFGLEVSSLTIAGAFVLGAVLGAVATMRLTRALIELAARTRRRLELEDGRERRERRDDKP